jgi:uncharacterized Fe-S cluster-containing protein
VISENDEVGFRVVEYGKSRKVKLPDALKRQVKEIGLRELRRRGVGQHTLENALRAHVRINTYRRIVGAIDAYSKERNKSEDPRDGSCAIPDGKER